MAPYITDLQVSLNQTQENELQRGGFSKLPGNLNEGTRGKPVHLWYKKGPRDGITRIQFTFTDKMFEGLNDNNYTQIKRNLNEGNDGDQIYLWFFKGSTPSDVPITDLAVALDAITEAQYYKTGWQRLACDLNRNAGEKRIRLFVKRQKPMYVCSITANANCDGDTNYFRDGFTRVDEDTNRDAGGSKVFIWYLLTLVSQEAITDLQVSINVDEEKSYIDQDYTQVKQNLNDGNKGNRVYLWYKKQGPENPKRDVSVITEAEAGPFKGSGINVIEKNLNQGPKGLVEYVCYTEWPPELSHSGGTQGVSAPPELSPSAEAHVQQ